ncbi:hypothetical protein [Solitalea canadensis]|uniref:Uncharacterized protein n=1 Tax=Solitalea canadensis (strain ATCC 29591 / DSM 3403 / JCM 21819 / LMG 8368 / NBRC 15130 / NCIMB 12057 / USAM 9D) TaxID=929556 RepID=H8KSE8_SOLCM|nr:hypothetical protein [Solitalea canadensis]AFD08056.1 hypothetical protein Solca_3037 [Solitalea canadensis DSM 3403]
MNTQLIYLIVITILPLVPSYILYKTLPSKTSVAGPFKGLTLNLSGAFAAYFLLFISLMGFTYANNSLLSENSALKERIISFEKASEVWTMEGQLETNSVEQTKFFIDDGEAKVFSTGRFKVLMRVPVQDSKPQLPEAICIFNRNSSYKVIDLNRLSSSDLKTYGIVFSDQDKLIRFSQPIKLPTTGKMLY